MFEYAVIFTYRNEKFAILIKSATSPKEAIKLGIERADEDSRYYESVEVVNCV